MAEKKVLALPSYQLASSSPSDLSQHAPLRLRLLVLLSSFLLTYHLCARVWPGNLEDSFAATTSPARVRWVSCGKGIEGYECANVTVPLDYHNVSDPRTVTIAVTRFPATDKANRQGAIFLNPGGPGGSGTNYVYRHSKTLSTIVKGQFDLIGFDPRGINMTRPYVSCFENKMEEEAFHIAANGFSLNLPSNISSFIPGVELDLERQIDHYMALASSLAHKCQERTGAEIAYMGTEAVARDIDTLSRLIEGEDKPINFWGFSYGTIIGQYLVKILSADRIGRVIIDGVVNPTIWSGYPELAHRSVMENVDDVLSSFASSCFAAGASCSLNAVRPSAAFRFTRPAALLEAIDTTLDALYAKPVPILDLPVPAVARASNLRVLLFGHMYSIASWPALADHLAAAFSGNFTGIVAATMGKAHAADATKPDSSAYAKDAIFCADTKPYDDGVASPSTAELAALVLESLERDSPRMGGGLFALATCHAWGPAGLHPRRSRYAGPFDMADGALATPVLVLSNTYDPVTPLASAQHANARLGDNARLVQQRGGWGHCSISHVSYCTARAVRAYMVHGHAPAENHTLCDVDQLPWQRFDDSSIVEDVEESELRRAWKELSAEWSKDLL